jgi:hypothetical protein
MRGCVLRLHHPERSHPADITVGANAALTSTMGHIAMTKQKVVTWDELSVQL